MSDLNSESYPQFTDEENEASLCSHLSEQWPGLTDPVDMSLSVEVTDSWKI